MEKLETSLLCKFKNGLKKNENLKNKCSFKIGGICSFYVEVTNIFQLKFVLKQCKKYGVKWFLLGAGSNVLFPEKFDGVVICLKKLNNIIITKTRVFAGAGVMLPLLCQVLKQNCLTGLEWANGIPGTVGGAVKMNAGAFNSQILDFVFCVYVLRNGKIKPIDVNKTMYGYRHNGFLKRTDIVLGVDFVFKKGKRKTIEQKMNQFFLKRLETQNVMFPSAGSIFKRTKTVPTSKLIDVAGLKGTKVGDAMISPVHSGYIVNVGNATADDVLALIKLVKNKIFKQFNEKLELEICVVKNN